MTATIPPLTAPTVGTAAAAPHPTEPPLADGLWPLAPPPLPVYRCGACGLYWLHRRPCCGRPARRVPAPYYVAASSETAAPDISVILLTHNDLPRTQRAVESLRRARGDRSVEFVFVDGCSSDGSLGYFRDLARREAVQLLVTHPREPFLAARNWNRGAEAASGRLLLFARTGDEIPDGDSLACLARCLDDPRAGVAGMPGSPGAAACGSTATPPPEGAWSVAPLADGLWGVRAEVFWELGALDESFRDGGCAAVDLQYRAIRRSYRLVALDSRTHCGRPALRDGSADRQRDEERFYVKHGCRLLDRDGGYPAFEAHVYPRISVAMACRNYGRFLPRALDSILGSYLPAGTALQVVAVNDASCDDTAGILEQYRLRYPEQVTVIHRSVSRGPAPAKNQAMARGIGDCTAPLDADDEFLPDKLWHSLEALDETGADFLYHDFIQVSADGRQEWFRIGRWSLRRWRQGTRLPPGCWVFRSGSVRFCERQITGEDPDFLRRHWSRLETVYLPEALTRYHMHGAGLSTRAMCKVVTGQLKGLPIADVRACADAAAGALR